MRSARELGVIVLVLASCGVAATWYRPSAPERRIAVGRIGLGALRPGDTYEQVAAAYGRMRPAYGRPDEWENRNFGPYACLVLASQPGENDLWQVARLEGGDVTLEGQVVLGKGETRERVLERLGEPDRRHGSECRWKLEPSRPYQVTGEPATPVLRLFFQNETLVRAEIFTGKL